MAKDSINKEDIMDAKYCPVIPCRWRSYLTYRLIISVFMLNDASMVFTSAHLGQGPLYLRALVYIATILLVGVPLVCSEICNAQFTNSSLISMWNYFPVLRGFGHGMIFLIFLRIIYLNILASWYLIYTFHAALDPPPWLDCTNVSKCLVKRMNVSMFQHCVDLQLKENKDCGFNTASYYFFNNEIGAYNTDKYPSSCFLRWYAISASICINFTIFLLAIKKVKYLQWTVVVAIFYILCGLLLLICVASSTDGAWIFTNSSIVWSSSAIARSFRHMTYAMLTTGCGNGMLSFLSRDCSFRSPANMTAIATVLFSSGIAIGFGFVIFSGVKTMYHYHNNNEYIFEVGETLMYEPMGTISEILGYFQAQPFWAFTWFSCVFFCLFLHVWLLHEFFIDLMLTNIQIARRYANLCRFVTKSTVILLTLPFYCSDLFESLMDAVYLIQIFNALVYSISLYWIYGFGRHSVDITFMIGVKGSALWKLLWSINPVLMLCIMAEPFIRDDSLDTPSESIVVSTSGLELKTVMLYVLLSLYVFVLIAGTLFELLTYRFDGLKSLVTPTRNWGPRDIILSKSREMFVPEIMTTEFLYRQVRIRGYRQKRKAMKNEQEQFKESTSQDSANKAEWSALTSN